jgi:hypothetical protein
MRERMSHHAVVTRSHPPIASLSLDLDNKWSYLKTHGEPGWESFPTYLPLLVPRVLAFLKERGLPVTVFIVGQDGAIEENRSFLRQIADAGHEIGSHSFQHDPWLHLYSEAEIERELGRAEEAIAAATGQHPRGFRGPGFSYSPAVLRVLARRGYRYDASTLPTFLGPLARAYYFKTARLSDEQKHRRRALFGSFTEGFRPNRPYCWKTEAGPLVEVPVTTMPIFRVPIHVSYLLYLSSYSALTAEAYFALALELCRMTDTPPSILLHPLDFLGCDDVTDLSFFPAMNLPSEIKLARVRSYLQRLAKRFEIVTIGEQVEAFVQPRRIRQ